MNCKVISGKIEPGQPDQAMADALCLSIYRETKALYEAKEPYVDGERCGFRILYGPPLVRPEIMFIGYQPGGRGSSVRQEQHDSWPTVCEYALEDFALKAAGWKNTILASRIKSVWGVPALQRSTGLNAVFFRSPNVRLWNSIDRAMRLELEDFSMRRAEAIARFLQPKIIAVIGIETFGRLLGKSGDIVLEAGDRALIKSGELWGAPAYGTIHLSGARISRADLDRIVAYFSDLSANA